MSNDEQREATRKMLDSVYEATTLYDLIAEARSQGAWCCEDGCGSGACETCPCCVAGWCVSGRDGLPDDAEDLARWLADAADYNPVAKLLAAKAEPVRPDRELLRRAILGVLWNASNFPEKVQARLLGQDMGPLTDKVTDAVLAHLAAQLVTGTVEPPSSERGDLWQSLDWMLWGVGMGDTFREPLADKMIAALSGEEFTQAKAMILDWNERRGGPLERNLFTELKAERDAAIAVIEQVRVVAERRAIDPTLGFGGFPDDMPVSDEYQAFGEFYVAEELRAILSVSPAEALEAAKREAKAEALIEAAAGIPERMRLDELGMHQLLYSHELPQLSQVMLNGATRFAERLVERAAEYRSTPEGSES